MAKRNPDCFDILTKYKAECGNMIRVSKATYPHLASPSHTQFLSKLLEISKQDIELSPEVLASFKTLMNHARDCARGRLKFTTECVPHGERDIGHEIENKRMKEIYLEMQNSFSRMKQKLRDSAESCRIDELLSEEKEEEREEEARPNLYDWLDEGEEEEEEEKKEEEGKKETKEEAGGEEEQKVHSDTTQRQVVQTRRKRSSKKKQHARHKENIQLLQEQVRETRVSVLDDIRMHLEGFDPFFINNMTEKTVGRQGERQTILQFRDLDGLYFTLDQMKDILVYSEVTADLFSNFMYSLYLLRPHESLTGVTTTDCITFLERISERPYLAEILTLPYQWRTMLYILLSAPQNSVLDNLNHLARIDPYVFNMLKYTSPARTSEVFNREKNVVIGISWLYKLAEQPSADFQYIVGKVSNAIAFAMKKKQSMFTVADFSKYFDVAYGAAISIMESGGRREDLSIPIDKPHQLLAVIDSKKDDVLYHTLVRCTVEMDSSVFIMPERFRPAMESAINVQLADLSRAFIKRDDQLHDMCLDLKQNGTWIFTRTRIRRETFHSFDFRNLKFDYEH